MISPRSEVRRHRPAQFSLIAFRNIAPRSYTGKAERNKSSLAYLFATAAGAQLVANCDLVVASTAFLETRQSKWKA